MAEKAFLLLENGRVFEGYSVGAKKDAYGEVVFTTGMTGYLETLTDKSYYGQIITQTFPLIGNYGVIPSDFEAEGIFAFGYIMKHCCREPTNFRSEGTIHRLLKERGIPGIYGIDTRELTRLLRNQGTMNGVITLNPSNVNMEMIKQYEIKNAVKATSVKKEITVNDTGKYHIAMIDLGYKENILRELKLRDCKVTVLPYNTDFERIRQLNPDGILISNGPGDPAENTGVVNNLKMITKLAIPLFGICLGHQLLALSFGFKTEKLKFGHRGVNQPVKDLISGRIYITCQNHGYTVKNSDINENIANLWFININDNTCEGLKYRDLPVFSVQFHPEGSCGPKDTGYLFDEFLKEVKDYAAVQKY